MWSSLQSLLYFFTNIIILTNTFTITKRTPVLELSQGKLVGLETGRGSFRKYLGIPYGSMKERFQEPGPPPKWEGVYNATFSSVKCAQYIERLGLPLGNENCLTLNIYSPGQVSLKRLFPVMVFIHGGGFRMGSNTEFIYNPEPLVKKGVIVITINYRLGVFGFLCLRIKGAPGNAGLKDQVAALKWVRDNIKSFGGNPDSVTIFGESAGSSSVSYLLLSQDAKGLFHKAILESATALSPFAFADNPIHRASLVATKLGYSTKNPHELLRIFNNATKNDLIMATVKTTSKPTLDVMSKYIFRPCAEKPMTGVTPYMTTSPKEILESGNFNRVPIIIGYNNKEGIFYAPRYNKTRLKSLNDNFSDILPDNLVFSRDRDKERVANEVKNFYFGSKIIDDSPSSVENFIDYLSDILVHYPCVAFTEYLLQNGNFSVYNYYFQYDSNRNLAKFFVGGKDKKGAAHADELFYLFQPIIFWVLPTTKNDQLVIERMTSLWTNFAKNGNPTMSISTTLPLKWVQSQEKDLKYLIIDSELDMDTIPNWNRIDFWKYIYSSYGA